MIFLASPDSQTIISAGQHGPSRVGIGGLVGSGKAELGKVLAQRIIAELESKPEPILNHDSSTNNLIRRY